MTRTMTTRISSFVTLTAVLAWILLSSSSFAAPVTWTGTDGGNPTFWDIGTTANWDNGGAVTYTDGDDVTFDDTGTGTTVNIQTAVSPTSFAISSATTNSYTFNGADISGATGITTSGGSVTHTFTREDYTFAGNVAMSGSADIDFQPASGTSHDFGTGTIQLNSTGARFEYNPATSGSTLTNNFEINAAGYQWRRPADSANSYGGTVTLNANISLGSHPETRGQLRSDVVLTDDRIVSAAGFTSGPAITGQVTSSGGTHDITINNFGSNPGWFVDISSPTTGGWDVNNIIQDITSGASEATLRVSDDEREFFDTMTANGGHLIIRSSGVQFARASTAEIGFRLVLNEDTTGTTGVGTGIRGNTVLDVVSGGLLAGDGTYQRGTPGCCTGTQPYNNEVDVNVSAGGEISPGDPTALDTVAIMAINGDLAFTGGTVTIEVTGAGGVAGVDFDQLIVQDSVVSSGSGNLSGLSNATLQLDFGDLTYDQLTGQTLDIILAENDLSGFNFGSVTGDFNGIDFDIIYGNGVIQLTNFQLHVPEPSSLTLLGFGAWLACWHRRRRVKSRS